MLVNEAPYDKIDIEITFPQKGNCYLYDAMKNRIVRAVISEQTDRQTKLHIQLEPYEATVVVFSDSCPQEVEEPTVFSHRDTLKGPFEVSFIKNESYPQAEEKMTLEELLPLQEIEGKEDFTGVIRYELSFSVNESPEAGQQKANLILNGAEEGKVYAPVSEIITMVADTKHAVGICMENGVEFLIYVGMDTVDMNGDGFEVKVNAEDHIQAGQLLMKFDMKKICSANHPTTTAFVLTNEDKIKSFEINTGKIYSAGERIGIVKEK